MEYGPDDKEKAEMEPEVKEIPAPAATPPVAAPAPPPAPAQAVPPPIIKATAKTAKPTKKALIKKGAKKAAPDITFRWRPLSPGKQPPGRQR